MKLISCHIENFGKINNFTYDFKPGLNVICEDNGWGKSTFAGFIKAMFYGFEGERKHSLAENERKRFKPWQGGTFGGQLVFETKGKTYRITRIFGDKEASDEFELRDEKTNLISDDFSSKIGEELFNIDKASFERTIFIEQNGCGTEMTGGINAKIGNLTDNTDDINNYESATKNITDMLNRLSATRSTGSVCKRKNEINDLQVKINDGNAIGEGIDRCSQLLKKAEEEREGVKSQIAAGQKVQKKVSALQALIAKKKEWEKLTAKEKEADEQLKAARAKFPGDVPAKEDIDVAVKDCAGLEQRKRMVTNLMLNDAEKETLSSGKRLFGDKLPAEEELSDMISAATSYKERKNQLDREMPNEAETEKLSKLEKEFASDNATASEMAGKWSERSNRANAITSNEAALFAMRSAIGTNKNQGQKVSPLMIVGILIIAAGLVSLAFLPVWAGIVIAAAGVVLIVVGIISKKPEPEEKTVSPEMENLQKKIDDDKAFIESVDTETKAYIEKHGKIFDKNTASAELQKIIMESIDYENLSEKAKKAEKILKDRTFAEEKERLRSFLDRFGINVSEDACIDALYELKAKRTDCVRLLEQLKNYNKEKEAYENFAKALDGFYKKYGYMPSDDMSSQLSDIRDDVFKYANLSETHEAAKKELKEYEAGNSMKDIISASEDDSLPTLDEVNESLRALDEKQEELHKQIVSYSQELDALQEKYDAWEDEKIRLEELKKEQEEEIAKSKALTAVKGFLSSAKETLTLKYAGPILESFKKYYTIVDDMKKDSFHIDANTNITVSEHGKQREFDTQSTGYQDLFAVCLRAALVDAMYRNESPTVIMDDPFTNLDDEKAKKAVNFLEKFAEDYQTIYFTCSSSRA